MEGCQIGIAHVCDTLRESELLKFVSAPPPKGDDDMRSRKVSFMLGFYNIFSFLDFCSRL